MAQAPVLNAALPDQTPTVISRLLARSPVECTASDTRSRLNPPSMPSTLLEAIQCWENSSIALECFGPDVHGHILSHAKAEWAAFNRHVTDWELTRYFERS
jgi:glutamine synthetase